MRITVLTLFPEMYRDFVSTSIIGRAIERGLVKNLAHYDYLVHVRTLCSMFHLYELHRKLKNYLHSGYFLLHNH